MFSYISSKYAHYFFKESIMTLKASLSVRKYFRLILPWTRILESCSVFCDATEIKTVESNRQ